jgi:hypothetical protein
MRDLAWSSLAALILGASACGDTEAGDRDAETDRTTADVRGVDSGLRRDAGRDAARDSRVVRDERESDASMADPAEGCGRGTFTTGSLTPNMLIVLDRSGSMKPVIPPADLRCDGDLDLVTLSRCWAANVDCSDAVDALTVNCGGSTMRPSIDRWTPSVNALKALTSKFEQDVAFGLATFPARAGRCGPGDFRVPVGLQTSAMIGSVLDDTKPLGGTPTGETLTAALRYFQEKSVGADQVSPAQYVLLVTDGLPTCPHGDGHDTDPASLRADKQLTLDAVDALSAAGIKTFVVGYDAQLDANLAQSLREFAQHGGTADYYPVQNEASLGDAFRKISEVVVSCTFDFKKPISDPALLRVTLDGVTLKLNDPNGWKLEGQTITIEGAPCGTLQNERASHRVELALECEPIIYL